MQQYGPGIQVLKPALTTTPVYLCDLQLLGINCFRVPFNFQTLFNQNPFSWANPTCTSVSSSQIEANVLPPNTYTSASLPPQAFPEKNNPSVCNQNLPNDSVYKRFLYIVQVRIVCQWYHALCIRLSARSSYATQDHYCAGKMTASAILSYCSFGLRSSSRLAEAHKRH